MLHIDKKYCILYIGYNILVIYPIYISG